MSARGFGVYAVSLLEEEVTLVCDVGFLVEFAGVVACVANNVLHEALLFLLLVELGVGLLFVDNLEGIDGRFALHATLEVALVGFAYCTAQCGFACRYLAYVCG